MTTTGQKANSEISLPDFLKKSQAIVRYLYSRWLVILLAGFLAGVAGVAYAWLTKPVYLAEMTFVTDNDNGSKLSAYAGIAAQFGFDMGSGGSNVFEGDNLIELLKSRSMVQTTLLTSYSPSELVIDRFVAVNGLNEGWSENPKTMGIKFDPDISGSSRAEDSIIQEVTSRIIKTRLNIFRKDKKLSLIVAQMKDGDEEFAKRFIELLASNAIRYYSDYKSRKARYNVEILESKVDSVRRMLFGNISEVAAINDLNVNPIKQSVRSGAQRKQVDVQVNGVLYTELLKNLEMAKMILSKETPLIQVIDKPMFPLEKKKPGRLRTGIGVAIFGGVLMVFFLLARRWIREQKIFAATSSN
jgi:uncharacterized protein involved in exopolysaccharide biosynthesis